MLKEMTLDQLKSLAYDELTKLETAKMNLRILSDEIKSRSENDKSEGNSEKSA